MESAHQQAEDWELVAANEVHIIDALKHEGNALFQQQRYFDAIQVYARALAQLPHDSSRLLVADQESLLTLEIAVRLNRALAYIELQDSKLLVYAEQDCTAALAKQPQCVKALYRRALARERLGKIQEALADAEEMHSLEPANPAAHALISRLQEAQPAGPEEILRKDMEKQCTISRDGSATAPVRSAADAWNDLQEQEMRLRQAYTKPKASMVKPTCKPKQRKTFNEKGEVLTKTESLWASLTEEEASTVAKVFKKRGPEQAKECKTTAASIHPSR